MLGVKIMLDRVFIQHLALWFNRLVKIMGSELERVIGKFR